MFGTASLISFSTWIGSKIADKGFDSIYSLVTSHDDINKKFYAAVDVTSKKLQNDYPEVLGGSIEYFFKSDDVFNELIKLLFKTSKVNIELIKKSFDTNTLPSEFISKFIIALKKELLKDKLFDEILSDKEIFLILQDAGINLKNIADASTISAQELKKIRNIIADKFESSFDYDEFIKLYKANALNSLSQVNFIGLGIDSSIKKNLQDIFVQPLFETAEKLAIRSHKDGRAYAYVKDGTKTIDYNRLIGYSNRIVILGNPGAGKSVLVKSLICDILSNSYIESKSKKKCTYIPFRIELRKYLAFKKENRGNIVRYLLSILDSEYLITNLTEQIISDLLTQKDCILFFDGLDEIFDINDKIATKTEIENFHNKFESVKSIVTSRIIGYEEASLNETFDELKINNFNDSQIDEYVNKWYLKEEEKEDVRNKEVGDFLSKRHEIDAELITNPLLLSLIVIIYRNILKLPESKLEIYQSCTKTLVDKWDASKDLKIDLNNDIYRNKDKIFADLAHWQYGHLSSKSLKITYEKARNTVAQSLLRIRLADEDTSEDLAETFMNYALRRSIYFDNNFTHKTFLEYYTAYWIYSNIEKKHNVKERNSIISKYVSNPFWFIVLELLLNLIDKDQADNDVIDEIVKKQFTNSSKSIPFLLTVILKLKNISFLVIQETVQSAIANILEPTKRTSKRSEEPQLYNAIETFIAHSDYSRSIVINQFKEIERKNSNNSNALLSLYTLYLELGNGFRIARLSNFELTNKDVYNSLCASDKYLYILNSYLFYKKDKAFLDSSIVFVKEFGPDAIFEEYSAKFDEYVTIPYFLAIIYKVILSNNIDEVIHYFNEIEKAGLPKEVILKKIQKYKRVFHLDNMDLNKLVKLVDSSHDNVITKIMLMILLNSEQSNHIPNREKRIKSIEDVISTFETREIILTALDSKLTFRQRATKILSLKRV